MEKEIVRDFNENFALDVCYATKEWPCEECGRDLFVGEVMRGQVIYTGRFAILSPFYGHVDCNKKGTHVVALWDEHLKGAPAL